MVINAAAVILCAAVLLDVAVCYRDKARFIIDYLQGGSSPQTTGIKFADDL